MWETFISYFTINPETGMVDLTWPVVIALIAAGFMVGIINTIAGSGTAITYSLFMMLGLPASVANGTIRFGVIMQTFAASATFYKGGKLSVKKGFILSIPVILGTVLGALIASNINQEVFEKVLGVVMLFMLVFIFYDPKKWLQEQLEKTLNRVSWQQYLLFFAVGLYGGFIHIGVGIFLLAVLVLNAGYDLVKANALKVFIVFLYSPFALAVFMLNNQVDYKLGLISAIGNVFGGIVASRMALNKGAGFVRWFLVIVIILFSIKLFLF
ncbi:MAG: sulfite exporter TauE/SafE family protein [Salinivirgaceae bacterium]|nr:sulfite exporter TauE/SafE family protein [Salinivirgaceae bacterium]